MPKFLVQVYKYFSSKRFYYLILILFVFEASWIALSAAYPQAFDENYHFGLIKIYSHFWLPFFSKQPPNSDIYGAVAAHPSYLYHYLISFPYRFIAIFIKSQTPQIIILRLINVVLFTSAIVLFRKILIKTLDSQAKTNVILMLFILIPIVPQLAAQINYDNLMIPLTAAMILLAFRIIDQLKAKKPSLPLIIGFISLCTLTSLVKYAFLPIFFALVVFLGLVLIRNYRYQLRKLLTQLYDSWQAAKPLAKIGIILLFVIAIGMFMQRDGMNLVRYHEISPDCSKILSIKACQNYSPWAYNYEQHMIISSVPFKYSNPIYYPFQWLYWMWYRLLFAVNGPNSSFENYPPLPLPAAAALIIFVLGVGALIKWWRKIFSGNIYLLLLFVVGGIYVIALMAQGYLTYRYTDVMENMNGRYLLPILLMFAAVFANAINVQLNKSHNRKMILAIVILVLFMEGGGLLTFIARSGDSWYLPNNSVVVVNKAVKKAIKHVVVKGSKRYGTPYWFFN